MMVFASVSFLGNISYGAQKCRHGGTVNILAGSDDPDHITGVIYARHFYYNNNPYAVHLEGVKIPTGVNKDGTTTGTTDLLPCGMMPRPEVRPLDTGFQAAWERLHEETGRIRMPAACTKCPRRSVCPVCAAVCVTETGGYPQIPGQAPSDEYSVKAK